VATLKISVTLCLPAMPVQATFILVNLEEMTKEAAAVLLEKGSV